jgi:hypothetical protein
MAPALKDTALGHTLQQTMKPQFALQGRLTAVKWISMTEPEVAREVKSIESDPFFPRLLEASEGARPVLSRKRWPASKLHQGFYELKEESAASSGASDIQDILEKRRRLVRLIRRIGASDFERFFLYGNDGLPLPEVCRRLGLKPKDGEAILSLVLEVGARSEFFRPTPASRAAGLRFHRIARIEMDPRDPANLFFQFTAPHWARGRYELDYEKLEDWKRSQPLPPGERRRLRALLNRIELLNMRQDTLFQILTRITATQSSFLRSRLDHRRRPLSLRELARRIGVAPSTVSRAIGTRSVELPWGQEVPLKNLLSGQRVVVMSLLSRWNEDGGIGLRTTDEQLMHRLAGEAGITVSRRTVNECRRKLLGSHKSSRLKQRKR